ncbi:CaiB/BaiF CoA transferase family protein [Streptomyces sp. NPDC001953]
MVLLDDVGRTRGGPVTALPLEGITVVSLEQAVAAPFATRQLADLGARVIKIERPGVGDFARAYDESVHGQSSYFVWLNRSKESVTLDLKSPGGREVLDRLLVDADVFVQNLAPGATRRLGLGAEDLAECHPKLIVCDISGYGNRGPWADRKAYDLLVQCETGVVSLTGSPEEPAKVGISIADIAAGMYAYSGILTALIRRATTGRGTPVEVSLFEALSEWMGSPAYYTAYSGLEPARFGAQHATIAPYGPFTARDGGTVLLAIQNEREWASFCEIFLKAADIAADERFHRGSARVANREELNSLIGERFAGLDAAAAVELLDRANVANARLNSVAEYWDHPVLAGRDRWRDVETPGGPIRALLPPATLGGVTPRMDPVPAVGEHTDTVLRALGYDNEAIKALHADGSV